MLKNRVLLQFLLTAGGLYVLWDYLYKHVLEEDGVIIRKVAEHVAGVSVSLLKLFGFHTEAAPLNGYNTLITLDGQSLVWIDSGCTGLTLMALFAGFIIAYPGPIVKKLWYIPAGILVIYLVNVLRVIALAINHIVSRGSFDFNHKYTYTLATYAAIFGLWMLWANRLSGVSLGGVLQETKDSEPAPADSDKS
jgi:exosortase family protein XrtF